MSHDQYDVIIIGSGAGGGTLAHRLAPSGKRILILERGGFLPREPQNWSSEAVFGANRYKAPETWHDRAASRSIPAFTIGSAAIRRCTARCCCDCASAISALCTMPTACRRNGRCRTAISRRITPRPSALYHVHGQRGSDPTEPPCDDPYPYEAISHEPRIQQLADDLERAGHRPFPLPVGIMLDEEQAAGQRLHPLRHLRRVPVSGAGQSRRACRLRDAGLAAPERHLADRRLCRAHRDQCDAAARCRRWSCIAMARSSAIAAISSSLPAARSIRRRCCCARPTGRIRTGSPTAPAWSGVIICATTTRR